MKDSDEQLIQRFLEGDTSCFEQLVERYQVLVCSVAYSIVGDFAASEDVGQEAFLTAWKSLGELRDRSRFKPWISTITRNLSRTWLRRRENSATDLVDPNTLPQPGSEAEMIERENAEEADLVWRMLAQLPESYREPLVLYYRQEQSVAQVADSLSLTESAAKQRLARGREMLKGEVLATIEKGLRKSAPATAFTLGVMAIVSSTPKTAAAAVAVGAIAKTATTATKAGAVGAAGGSLIGLLGGFFGAANSWRHAEYQSQRSFIVKQSAIYLIFMVLFSIPFAAMGLGWNPVKTLGRNGYSIAHTIWMLSFMSLNFVWMFWSIRRYNSLQQQEREADTQRLPRYKDAEKFNRKGPRWSSSGKLLGLPLIQVAYPDAELGMSRQKMIEQGTARAWIAIGHHAYGRLFAMGNRAVAPVAVGIFAGGLFSLGVISVGIVSLGVVSIALLSIGTLAVGGFSIGCGMAFGVWAVAPMAFGVTAAQGAVAYSFQFAQAPSAFARHANDDAAAKYFLGSWMTRSIQAMSNLAAKVPKGNSSPYLIGGFFALYGLIQLGIRLVYRRESPDRDAKKLDPE